MIRAAKQSDIPSIVRMTADLARATGIPIAVDEAWTSAFVSSVLASGQGLALVVDIDGKAEGMIVATIGQSSVSPALIAIEHGWYCSRAAAGYGVKLLAAYEAWARAKGCAMARMSTAHASPLGHVLVKRHGYGFAETALAKVL
jgi:GNAT superfamily N-acetyltransferase